jgi:tetratricopeptide (TPR) repeat protein
LDYRNSEEAERNFATAVGLLTNEIPPQEAGDDVGLALADAYHHRGERLESLMQWREALALYQDALKIRDGLCWKNNSDRAFRRDLARSYSAIGHMELQLWHMNRAREAYDKSEKLRRTLVEETPQDEEARYLLARSCSNKGKFFLWKGDLAPADRHYCEARGLFDALATEQPAVVRYKADLADVQLWLAEIHLDQNKPDDVATTVKQARAILDELQKRGADEVATRSGKVRCAVILARLRARTDPAGAAEDAGKIVDQMAEFRKFLNIEKRQMSSDDMYNSAVARALHGDRDRAQSTLKSAVNSYGYRNFARLRLDTVFTPLLAKDADFRKAVDNLEKEAKKTDEEAGEESTSSDS